MSNGTAGTAPVNAPATAPAAAVPADWPTAGDEVVTDASLWLHAALPMHPYHAQARAFVAHCVAVGARMMAPPLWESETDSGVRRAAVNHQITAAAAGTAQRWIDAAPVAVLYEGATRRAARALADVIAAPRVYDATYGALAQAHGCEVWTADARFFNAASAAGIGFVKFIGAYPDPTVPTAATAPPATPPASGAPSTK